MSFTQSTSVVYNVVPAKNEIQAYGNIPRSSRSYAFFWKTVRGPQGRSGPWWYECLLCPASHTRFTSTKAREAHLRARHPVVIPHMDMYIPSNGRRAGKTTVKYIPGSSHDDDTEDEAEEPPIEDVDLPVQLPGDTTSPPSSKETNKEDSVIITKETTAKSSKGVFTRDVLESSDDWPAHFWEPTSLPRASIAQKKAEAQKILAQKAVDKLSEAQHQHLVTPTTPEKTAEEKTQDSPSSVVIIGPDQSATTTTTKPPPVVENQPKEQIPELVNNNTPSPSLSSSVSSSSSSSSAPEQTTNNETMIIGPNSSLNDILSACHKQMTEYLFLRNERMVWFAEANTADQKLHDRALKNYFMMKNLHVREKKMNIELSILKKRASDRRMKENEDVDKSEKKALGFVAEFEDFEKQVKKIKAGWHPSSSGGNN